MEESLQSQVRRACGETAAAEVYSMPTMLHGSCEIGRVLPACSLELHLRKIKSSAQKRRRHPEMVDVPT